MKRFISVIIVFSILLSMFAFIETFAADKYEFVENFEKKLSKWNINGDDNGELISIIPESGTNGKNVLKIDSTKQGLFSMSSEYIAVSEGHDYLVSIDHKIISGSGPKIYVQFLNSSGKSVKSTSFKGNSSEWSTISKVFSAPEGASWLVIFFQVKNEVGESLYDNITVKEKGLTYVDNYETKKLNDGDVAFSLTFDEPLDNSFVFSSEAQRANIFVDFECYSEGKGSLHLNDDLVNSNLDISTRKFGVEEGGKYTLAADFYMAEGSRSKIYMAFYNEADIKIHSSSASATGGSWVKSVSNHTAPKDAVYGRIIIQSTGTVGRSFVDNIKVYKGHISVDTTIENPVTKVYVKDYRKEDFLFANKYDMPDFKPTIGHPRLYFNKNDIEIIKKNATHPQNSSAYKQLLEDVANTEDGHLMNSERNLDCRIMGIIQSKAFYYAVWGDEKAGKEAISMLNNFCDDANPDTQLDYNTQGYMVTTIAAVYDWCYPLLTETDKKYFQNMGCVAASSMEILFPPTYGNVLNGHSAESQLQRDQMAFAIAVYDERPDIYQNIAGRFFGEMVYTKQWLATAKSSVYGDSYSTNRYQWEVFACYMMSALGIDNIYSEDHGKVLYWNLYARRGDGQLLRDGDSTGNNTAKDTYNPIGSKNYFLAGNYYKDPYLKGEFMRINNGLSVSPVSTTHSLSAVEFLCFNDPSIEYETVRELPLTMYYPSPKEK